MFAQKVTGLQPGGYYKATAKVKTDMIRGGAFCNFPANANVVTTMGQPMSPFRTDDWEIPAEEIGKIQ